MYVFNENRMRVALIRATQTLVYKLQGNWTSKNRVAMSRHLLVTKLFVPQACVLNTNLHIVLFSDDGLGLPIIALKNMTVEVLNGSEPAIQKGVVPSRTLCFRTMVGL